MPTEERNTTDRPMDRRAFTGHIGAVLASLTAPGMIRSARAAATQPNVLLIESDEHDPAVLGCYGDATVRTPNFDRLAEDGVVFENCYCNSPLCVPSRLSLLAGKYCSRVGAWSNNSWLASDETPSLPRSLASAGYDCYLSGKMHLDKTRRYGLRELFPAFTNRYDKQGTGARREATDAKINVKSWSNRAKDFRIGDKSQTMDHDRQVTGACLEFLRDRQAGDRPFFLLAGYLAPHFPLIVPQENYSRYRDRIPMPNLPEGHLRELTLNYQHLRRGFATTEATDEQTKMGRECYWALTDWFDTEVGKLLNGLASSDVADNTIVIYISDHGENKGDHGLWWKNCMYEASARVPLIVRWPKRWAGGQRRTQVCSLVDVVQTILEASGAEPPEDWNGRSLVATLDDARNSGPDFAVSEYYGHNIASGFTMYRAGPYKYVYHNRMNDTHGPLRELYDLSTDPGEFVNLAGRPEFREPIESMHRAMVREVGRDPDETERICRTDYARGYAR